MNKTFIQIRRRGDGKYELGGISPLPLYNRSRIKKTDVVIVCEGERCVHALHTVGIVATTKPCGGQAPDKADWEPLYGKTVVLWPDNDEKGIKYMESVRALLIPHCKVKWIDPAKYELPDKGDAYDWVYGNCKNPDGTINKQMAKLPVEEATDCGTSGEVEKQLLDIATGRRTAIGWPWLQVGRLSQALIPQTTTLICGEGGDGKSLFISQVILGMMQSKVKFAVYDLEEDIEHRVCRALSQIEENSDLLDYEWLAGKDKEVTEICGRNKEFMDELGRSVWAAPDKAIQRDVVLAWIETRAKEDCRVIIIDPITALRRSSKTIYEADEEFVSATKVLNRKYNMSTVFVTHPAKGRLNPVSIDGLQGGSAYGRFCQTIIWVEWIEEKEVRCLTPCGITECSVNRKVHLIKTRNGKGNRAVLGFWFDKNTLLFKEYGVIKKKK